MYNCLESYDKYLYIKYHILRSEFGHDYELKTFLKYIYKMLQKFLFILNTLKLYKMKHRHFESVPAQKFLINCNSILETYKIF